MKWNRKKGNPRRKKKDNRKKGKPFIAKWVEIRRCDCTKPTAFSHDALLLRMYLSESHWGGLPPEVLLPDKNRMCLVFLKG